jgi:hypothetical protein
MCPADLFLDDSDRVFFAGIDCDFGSQLASQLHLFRTDIDSGNVQSHRLRILHGNVAQPSNS